MKKIVIILCLICVLIISGCKTNANSTTNIEQENAIEKEMLDIKASCAPIIEIYDQETINSGIHVSDNASSTIKLENKIDSIINQIGDK